MASKVKRNVVDISKAQYGDIVGETDKVIISVFSQSGLGNTYSCSVKNAQRNARLSLGDVEEMIREAGFEASVTISGAGALIVSPVAPEPVDVHNLDQKIAGLSDGDLQELTARINNLAVKKGLAALG